nr:glycine-rich cell wall structural protein-like [Onthophagus taurus]
MLISAITSQSVEQTESNEESKDFRKLRDNGLLIATVLPKTQDLDNSADLKRVRRWPYDDASLGGGVGASLGGGVGGGVGASLGGGVGASLGGGVGTSLGSVVGRAVGQLGTSLGSVVGRAVGQLDASLGGVGGRVVGELDASFGAGVNGGVGGRRVDDRVGGHVGSYGGYGSA